MAENAEVDAILYFQVAGHHWPGIHANANVDLLAIDLQAPLAPKHRQARTNGPELVVGRLEHPENRHQAIAHILKHRAAMVEDNLGHVLVILAEHLAEVARAQPLGQASRVADVDK